MKLKQLLLLVVLGGSSVVFGQKKSINAQHQVRTQTIALEEFVARKTREANADKVQVIEYEKKTVLIVFLRIVCEQHVRRFKGKGNA